MRFPEVAVNEALCGAASTLLAIHNAVIAAGSSSLLSLDVIGTVLRWVDRLAPKICRGNSGTL